MADAGWIDTPGSSHVKAIKYEEENRNILIEFNDGSVYMYTNVPPSVWEEFLNHGSKGRFVNIVLRRQYTATRIR